MEELNIVALANIIQIIPTALGFYVSSTINRKKQTKISCIACLIQALVYLMLKAYRGMTSVLYYTMKNFYLLIFHKEEKIVINKVECAIFGLPLLIIGIAGYMLGGLFINVIVGIADFIDVNIYFIENEKTRFVIQIICVIIWAIYMWQIGNYVGVVEYGITVMIFVFNIIRLVKNKENRYYKETEK